MDWFGHDEVRDALQRYECVAGKSGNEGQARDLITITEEKIAKKFKDAVVDGGVVNGRAKKLVAPPYPARPGFPKVTGKVEVQVIIDETGRIIFACARNGYPLFQSHAEDAALRSTFVPTLVNGKPVKVTGIIVYNFVP